MVNFSDPRRKARIILMQELYAEEFGGRDLEGILKDIQNYDQDKYKVIKNAYNNHKDKIDALIRKHAPQRPLKDMNKVDISILRIAIAEAFFTDVTPVKVVIDEAVEIAKIYGNNNSYKLINGVLGSILKELGKNNKKDAKKDN